MITIIVSSQANERKRGQCSGELHCVLLNKIGYFIMIPGYKILCKKVM